MGIHEHHQGAVDVINLWLADAPDYVRAELLSYLKDYAEQPELLPRQPEDR